MDKNASNKHSKVHANQNKKEYQGKTKQLTKIEQDHGYIFSNGLNKSSQNSLKQMIQKLQNEKVSNSQKASACSNLKCNESELGRSMYKYIKGLNDDEISFDKTKAYRFTINNNSQGKLTDQPDIIFKQSQKINFEITDQKAYDTIVKYFKNQREKEENKINGLVDHDPPKNKNKDFKIFDSESDSESNINDKSNDLNEQLFEEEDNDIFKYKNVNLSDLLHNQLNKHMK